MCQGAVKLTYQTVKTHVPTFKFRCGSESINFPPPDIKVFLNDSKTSLLTYALLVQLYLGLGQLPILNSLIDMLNKDNL